MDHENRFKERGLLLSVGDMSTTRNPLPDRGFSDLATDKGAPGWVCGAARLLGNLGHAGPLDPPGLAPLEDPLVETIVAIPSPSSAAAQRLGQPGAIGAPTDSTSSPSPIAGSMVGGGPARAVRQPPEATDRGIRTSLARAEPPHLAAGDLPPQRLASMDDRADHERRQADSRDHRGRPCQRLGQPPRPLRPGERGGNQTLRVARRSHPSRRTPRLRHSAGRRRGNHHAPSGLKAEKR